MKPKIPIEELLRWRLQQAKSEAPYEPSAARLLDLARPWWERRPERFQSLVAHLNAIKMVGHNDMAESKRGRGPQPIPALVIRGKEIIENSIRIEYFRVRDGKLCMRFRMQITPRPAESTLELTMVSDRPACPVFCARATASDYGVYCIEAEILAELAQSWEGLKLKDPMPFKVILRSITDL